MKLQDPSFIFPDTDHFHLFLLFYIRIANTYVEIPAFERSN